MPKAPVVNTRFELTLLVTNGGSADTKAGKIGIWLDLDPKTQLACGAEGATVLMKLPALKAGKSKLVTSTSKKLLAAAAAGTKNMRVFINWKCTTANPGVQYTLQYKVTATPMPDLEVNNLLGAGVSPQYPSNGGDMTASFTVYNAGTAASLAGVKISVWANIPNTVGVAEPKPCGAGGADATKDVKALQPGEAMVVQFDLKGGNAGYVNGSYALAFVDPTCTLEESEEARDQQAAIGYFAVPSPMAYFDVIITALKPKTARRGKPLTVTLNVANNGGKDAAIGKVAVWTTASLVPDKWCTSGANAAAVKEFTEVVKVGENKDITVEITTGVPDKKDTYLMSAEADSGCANVVADPPRNTDPALPKLPPSSLAGASYKVK